jgi:tetratricopeptide (TPR) repeat protein
VTGTLVYPLAHGDETGDPAEVDENRGRELRNAELQFKNATDPERDMALAASLFNQAEREADVEAAYRRAIHSGHPDLAPAAAYGLGLLLARFPDRFDEAEWAFRSAVASGHREYAPLAAYDLGTLLAAGPGRLPDAEALFAAVAHSGHKEYAALASFNLGVLLADVPGRQGDAEAAYAQAIASSNTDIAAMAAVNLGSLLEGRPDRLADAEAAYGGAIDSGHPDQAPMAAANLGNLLAAVAGREDDAEAAYRKAIASGHPAHAPRAQYNLGVLLLGRPGRRADAEAAFRAAAASVDPGHAPRAAYNLGRLIAEDPARRREAEAALAAAAESGDPEVAPWAEYLLASLRGNDAAPPEVAAAAQRLVERPALAFDGRPWRRVTQRTDGRTILEEYLPEGETLDEWTEMVTLRSTPRGEVETPLDAVAEGAYAWVEPRVVDGDFEFRVLDSRDDELLYDWSLQDDAASVDQLELVRVVRGVAFVHMLQYATRASPNVAQPRRNAWLGRLRAVVLRHGPWPVSDEPEAEPPREVPEILDRIQSEPVGGGERLGLLVRALALTSRRVSPELWASIQFLLATELRARRDVSGAVAAYRRALEVFNPHTTPDMWARSLAALGRVYGTNEPRHAAATLRRAAGTFVRGTPEWAEATIDLGVVLESEGDADDLDAARQLFGDALDEIVSNPAVHTAGNEFLTELLARADDGVRRTEFRLYGEPILPPGERERERRAEAVYLRPLVSSGRLVLRNAFRDPASLAVQFKREPEEMTLEAILYRVLGGDLLFTSVGGRPEGYGVTRVYTTADDGTQWREIVRLAVERAQLVFIVPHLSEGVRWEIGYLIEQGALPRTLWVMPPASPHFDVEAMWIEAEPMLAELGLALPRYDPAGMLVQVGPEGTMVESWPFEDVWTDALLDRIEHLLPAAERTTGHDPWQQDG